MIDVLQLIAGFAALAMLWQMRVQVMKRPAPPVPVTPRQPRPPVTPERHEYVAAIQKDTGEAFLARVRNGRPVTFCHPLTGRGVLRYTGAKDTNGRHVYELKHGD